MKFWMRVDQLGHLIHCDSNFLIELFPLIGGQPALAEEFSVGNNGRKRVTQIMRDRTSHAPDGGEPLRLQQLLLRLPQAGPHSIEGSGYFGDLITATSI